MPDKDASSQWMHANEMPTNWKKIFTRRKNLSLTSVALFSNLFNTQKESKKKKKIYLYGKISALSKFEKSWVITKLRVSQPSFASFEAKTIAKNGNRQGAVSAWFSKHNFALTRSKQNRRKVDKIKSNIERYANETILFGLLFASCWFSFGAFFQTLSYIIVGVERFCVYPIQRQTIVGKWECFKMNERKI